MPHTAKYSFSSSFLRYKNYVFQTLSSSAVQLGPTGKRLIRMALFFCGPESWHTTLPTSVCLIAQCESSD